VRHTRWANLLRFVRARITTPWRSIMDAHQRARHDKLTSDVISLCSASSSCDICDQRVLHSHEGAALDESIQAKFPYVMPRPGRARPVFVAAICGRMGLVKSTGQVRRLLFFLLWAAPAMLPRANARHDSAASRLITRCRQFCCLTIRVRLESCSSPSPFDTRAERGRRREGAWIRACAAQEQFVRPVTHITGQRLAQWP
jgi:hypothetical protein